MSPLPSVLTAGLLDVATERLSDLGEVGAVVGLAEVPEAAVTAAARSVPEGSLVDVCVVAAAGAGSLLALARRRVDRVRIRAVRVALRDLDDLAGNAARVVAAARELPDQISVRVGLPYAPGWLAAGEEVEAAGLEAAIEARDPSGFADQLSGLIELDLPFTISRCPYAVPALMTAVDALVDGADSAEVGALLGEHDQDRWRTAAGRWDHAACVRIRRRLRAITTTDLDRSLSELDLIS